MLTCRCCLEMQNENHEKHCKTNRHITRMKIIFNQNVRRKIEIIKYIFPQELISIIESFLQYNIKNSNKILKMGKKKFQYEDEVFERYRKDVLGYLFMCDV